MPILYSLVARGTVVLAEFSAAAGNASSIARRILEKFPEGGDTRASYSQVSSSHISGLEMEHQQPVFLLLFAVLSFGSGLIFAVECSFPRKRSSTTELLPVLAKIPANSVTCHVMSLRWSSKSLRNDVQVEAKYRLEMLI